jgi:N-acetylglutamate synthase-like GNAT family acetyltransferase
MSTFDDVTIRPPWPDEIPRLQHFLPAGFLFDDDPFLLVAVSGRVERFVAALAMTLRPLQKIKATWLCVRVDNNHSSGGELLRRSLDEAWQRGAQSVYFGQTIDEEADAARGLKQMGFEPAAVHEVYEVDSRQIWERTERIRQRLHARALIPPDVELTTLQPSVVPRARKFLVANLPESASILALETAGYKAEHSIALLQNGEVKGVLLSRRLGPVSYVGLRAVAEELRGGVGWANLLMLNATLASGLQTGLETVRFEFNPDQHLDTKQFAEVNRARLVGRRVLFKIQRPA